MLINLEWGVYYPPRRINLLISIKCDWFRLYNFQRNYKLHITWLKVRKYIPFIWEPFITTQSYKSYEYLGFTKCANVDKSSISDSCKIIQVHFFLSFALTTLSLWSHPTRRKVWSNESEMATKRTTLEPPYQYGHLNEHPMYPIGVPPIPPPKYLIVSQKPSTLTYEYLCHVFLLILVVLDYSYHHLETHGQSPYSYVYRSKINISMLSIFSELN